MPVASASIVISFRIASGDRKTKTLGSPAHIVATLSKFVLMARVNTQRRAVEAPAGVDGVTISRFAASDVVRHPLVGRIVEAYGKLDARKTAEG